MVRPARAWEYRSNPMRRIFESPNSDAKTTPSIVAMVTMPNMDETRITSKIFPFAAGYIRSGIKGSQGPKTKIVNKTQGVRLTGA